MGSMPSATCILLFFLFILIRNIIKEKLGETIYSGTKSEIFQSFPLNKCPYTSFFNCNVLAFRILVCIIKLILRKLFQILNFTFFNYTKIVHSEMDSLKKKKNLIHRLRIYSTRMIRIFPDILCPVLFESETFSENVTILWFHFAMTKNQFFFLQIKPRTSR